MIFASFIISLIVALAYTIVFVAGFQRKGPWASVVAFFMVVFLSTWAGGIWIAPVGSDIRSVSWLPFAVVGLVTSLILAASVPSWFSTIRTQVGLQPERRKPPVALLSSYFWLALIVMIVTIAVR
ncbi:MAG: hypothetical protein A2219_05825 [Elusimicrobia bacterium RIFOXYA2_FULL_50_26]|nr:MAG: hypothetical protein A2219_05825 [Elusimicrobia bacterium RIFOXYA2_FULL_50_26]OGS24876.1 MAG: hypothetical protein A2314_08880 [Elusimicrobia bacterium RIFOXYB2_FULL_50_12]